jgi:hypothetical protein
MLLLSFPLGTFIVFDSDIGDDINFEYPIGKIDLFAGLAIPSDIVIGDVFVVLWAVYAILFAIAFLGPEISFLKTLSALLSHGKTEKKSNYMLIIVKWLSILILVSVIIDYVQNIFGIVTIPPPIDNDLVQFLYVSMAPVTEELVFRVLLIGLPLFVFYSHKFSVSHFFKSLWSPSILGISASKKPIFLMVAVGVFFGLAHVITGDPWSEGKFAQATVSGIILGWLYLKFGLLPSVLVHWGTNYFVFSYANFISQINEITIEAAFLHPLLNTMEMIFVISGILAVSVLLINHFSKREANLSTGS